MSNDSFAKSALAPLVLRLALASIFIYHGLEKIVPKENDWGSAWATEQWKQQAKPPKEVADTLDKFIIDLTGPEREPGKEPPDPKGDPKAAKQNAAAVAVQDARVRVNLAYGQKAVALPSSLEVHWAQLAVAWGELLGGIALLIGFLPRIAALGLMIIQVGAIYTVTWERGFSFASGGGYEYNVAILAMCLAVVCLGGGPLSVSGL